MGLDMYLKRARAKEICSDVGYWRKANAIHGWFVNNVQNGNDDCGEYPVCRQDLQRLRVICARVLENRDLANKLLPTTQGFFFGRVEYDEYYFSSLQQTIIIIDECLKLPDEWEFYYEASW